MKRLVLVLSIVGCSGEIESPPLTGTTFIGTWRATVLEGKSLPVPFAQGSQVLVTAERIIVKADSTYQIQIDESVKLTEKETFTTTALFDGKWITKGDSLFLNQAIPAPRLFRCNVNGKRMTLDADDNIFIRD